MTGRAGLPNANLVIARSSCDEAIQSSFAASGLLRGACHRARIRDPLARNDGESWLPNANFVIAMSSCDEAIQSFFVASGLLRGARNDEESWFAKRQLRHCEELLR